MSPLFSLAARARPGSMKALLKGKSSGRLKTTFTVSVHTLAPWSPGAGPLKIKWARGGVKRGVAGPPVDAVGGGGDGYAAAYEFDQTFTVPATLTKVKV